jgi:hypothetical protein
MKALLIAIMLDTGFVVSCLGGDGSLVPTIISPKGSITTNTQAGMSTRIYKITPVTFLVGLKNLITPKDGESDGHVLGRYLLEHDVHLLRAGSSLFVNERLGTLSVTVVQEDQDKVYGLLATIINAK